LPQLRTRKFTIAAQLTMIVALSISVSAGAVTLLPGDIVATHY
jgi:hypothetical protein